MESVKAVQLKSSGVYSSNVSEITQLLPRTACVSNKQMDGQTDIRIKATALDALEFGA